MLERISAISGGIGNVEVKWVAFRDYDLEKSKVLEASPWTEDPASLVKFVGSIQCRGGADYEEAVEAALTKAARRKGAQCNPICRTPRSARRFGFRSVAPQFTLPEGARLFRVSGACR